MSHIHACYKHMFQVCIGVSYGCLQVFYLDVVYVCNDFQIFFRFFYKCFRRLFQVFYFVFFCMLQLLHMNDSKVDRMLHMRCVWEAAGGADDIRGGVGDVRDGAGPLLVLSLMSPTCYALICSLYVAASGR